MVLPGTCDFEKDVCGNKVSSYGRFMPITWKRTDEKQQYGPLRIEGDHTKNDDKSKEGTLKFDIRFTENVHGFHTE